jgi:hypothetical protein
MLTEHDSVCLLPPEPEASDYFHNFVDCGGGRICALPVVYSHQRGFRPSVHYGPPPIDWNNIQVCLIFLMKYYGVTSSLFF